jgi:hypothetical protein
MPVDLSQLTIAELFAELPAVEQAIRTSGPTVTAHGSRTTVNARLIALADREQRICDELAERRRRWRDLQRERFAGLQTQPSSAPAAPAGPGRSSDRVARSTRPIAGPVA